MLQHHYAIFVSDTSSKCRRIRQQQQQKVSLNHVFFFSSGPEDKSDANDVLHAE